MNLAALTGPWAVAVALVEFAAALATLIAAAWLAGRRERYGNAGTVLVVSLLLTSAWTFAIALSPLIETRQGLFEALSNLGWLLVTYRLFAGDGRHASLAPIRRVFSIRCYRPTRSIRPRRRARAASCN